MVRNALWLGTALVLCAAAQGSAVPGAQAPIRQFAVDNRTGHIIENIVLKRSREFANGDRTLSPAHWMITVDGKPREIGQGTSQGITTLIFDRRAVGPQCVFQAEIQFDPAGGKLTRQVDLCKQTMVYLGEADLHSPTSAVAASAAPPAPPAAAPSAADDDDWGFGDDDDWQQDSGAPFFQGQIYGDCQALFGGCYQEIPGSGSNPQFLYRVGDTEHSSDWSDRRAEITEMFPSEQSGPSGAYRSRSRIVTFHCKARTLDYSSYSYNADDGHYLSTDESGGATNVNPGDVGPAYSVMYTALCH
jgi:hypothetical protein